MPSRGPEPTEAETPRRRRRWPILAGVGALVLLLLVAGIVSWHFSSFVLAPDHSGWPEETRVDAVSADRVALDRSEDSERPGLYGLDWQAGHALAGAVIRIDDDRVTRRLSAVRGYLEPGMKVAIDTDVYAGNPRQARDLPFVGVHVPGELGPMPAWLIPGRNRTTWAIVVHGINGDPQAGLRLAPALRRDGLTSLLITYREDLGAPESPDGYHHQGLTEWHDLEAAARFALDHGAHRLILVGYSMGGAIVTQFMQKSSLRTKVSGLVLDAPALDWKRTIAFNATEMGLPSAAALPVEWAIDARIQPNWDSLDALGHPEDFHLPILLFHGTEDDIVPIATSDDFAQELPRWVTYYRVPRAGHTQSWNVDPKRYEKRLGTFLASTLTEGVAARERPPLH